MDQRRIRDAGGIELFTGYRCANDGENARANHRPDAKRSQRPRTKGLFQGVLRLCRVPDQFVDRLAGKQLAWQRASPRPRSRFRKNYLNSAGAPCALAPRNPVLGLERSFTASTGRAPTSSLSSSSRHERLSAGPWVQPSCGLRVLPSCVQACLQSWMYLPRVTSFPAIASMIPFMRADVSSIVTGILFAGKLRICSNPASNRYRQLAG